MKTVKRMVFTAVALVALSGFAFGADPAATSSDEAAGTSGYSSDKDDISSGSGAGGATTDTDTYRGSGTGGSTYQSDEDMKSGSPGGAMGTYSGARKGGMEHKKPMEKGKNY